MDNTPFRQLVKDGVWLVPPEERPANWRLLPVREPDGMVGEPLAQPAARLAQEAPESGTEIAPAHEAKTVAGKRNKAPRGSTVWKDARAQIAAAMLAGESEILVRLPAGKGPGQLRSVLSMWKETNTLRWSIRCDEDGFAKVSVVGRFPSAARTIEPASEEADKALQCAISRRISQIDAEVLGVPAEVHVVQPTAENPAAEELSWPDADPPLSISPLSWIPAEGPRFSEFLSGCIHIWGVPPDRATKKEDLVIDRLMERVSDLGTEMRQHREAKSRTDELLGAWVKKYGFDDADIYWPALHALWAAVHGEIEGLLRSADDRVAAAMKRDKGA